MWPGESRQEHCVLGYSGRSEQMVFSVYGQTQTCV